MDVTTPVGGATNTTGASKKKKQELRTWLINNKPAGQRDVLNMTVQDVSNFLRSIDLHLLAQEVENKDVDGEMLNVIEKHDLDELKLGTGIHRYKFMQVLKRYRESINSGDESDSNVSMTNETYSRSLPNSPTNSGIIRTTTPPASAPTSPESGARERGFSSAGRRRSQSGTNILASIDEGKSTDDDELMGPLVTEAFEKMKVGKPMKKVESYVVFSNVGENVTFSCFCYVPQITRISLVSFIPFKRNHSKINTRRTHLDCYENSNTKQVHCHGGS